jgi:hypothetical protein
VTGRATPADNSASGQPDQDGPQPADKPTLRIINGNPTPEEVAAVTVVLTAIAGGASNREPEPVTRAGTWADPALRMRRPIHPGQGAWRASVWY